MRLEKRVRALWLLLIFVVLSLSLWLFISDSPKAAGIMLVFGLLRAKSWLWPLFRARHALATAPFKYQDDLISVSRPAGWTATQEENPQGPQLDLDGPDAWALICYPLERQESPVEYVDQLIAQYAAEYRIREIASVTRRVSGITLAGKRVVASYWKTLYMFEFVSGLTPDGRVFSVILHRGVFIPQELLDGICESIHLVGHSLEEV